MFKITIEGASLTDLAANILTMASQFQTTAVQESKPTTGKPRKAASSAATVDSASSAASVDAASTDDKPITQQEIEVETQKEPDTTAPNHPIELGAIKERALLYSQKAGPTVIGEMLQNAGAPTGKFSEIGENMDALKKVSDALAAAGY
jgi:hypothetical protein